MFVYKKSSSTDENSKKKTKKALCKDLNIHSKKYCFMTKG